MSNDPRFTSKALWVRQSLDRLLVVATRCLMVVALILTTLIVVKLEAALAQSDQAASDPPDFGTMFSMSD